MDRFYQKLGKIFPLINKWRYYMFGMGFMEILLIAIIAIIALGPDKLPGAMVEVAKFLKKFKSGVADAKSTLDNELNITEMKNEANKFKAQIEDAKSITKFDDFNLGVNDILKDELTDDKSNNIEKKESKEDSVEIKEELSKESEVKNLDKENKPKNSDKFKVKKKKVEEKA